MMDAVKLAVVGFVLLVCGGAAVAFGVLPRADALAIADRAWPVLLFVVAVTVVAELAALAGVFDVAAVASALLLWLIHRRALRGRFTVGLGPHVADPLLLKISAAVIIVMLPILVSGIPPWMPAVGAAVALVGVFAWRSPAALQVSLVPWQLVVFASGLFLAVGALEAWGSTAVLAAATGTGDDLVSLWQLSGVGVLSANAINNLPAYLALEPVADSPARVAALLIGVGAGPLITPWASLATLLWHERLRADGIDVPWKRYMLWGLLGTPLIVGLAVIPLAWR